MVASLVTYPCQVVTLSPCHLPLSGFSWISFFGGWQSKPFWGFSWIDVFHLQTSLFPNLTIFDVVHWVSALIPRLQGNIIQLCVTSKLGIDSFLQAEFDFDWRCFVFQVVRTVLQEERRDPGVPTPKARQVFTLLWNQSFVSDYIFNYSRKHFHFAIHQCRLWKIWLLKGDQGHFTGAFWKSCWYW